MSPNPRKDATALATSAVWRPTSRMRIAILLLFGATSLSYAWRTVDNARYSAPAIHNHDSLQFATILRTGQLDSAEAPFRYRPLTPLLASMAPPPPTWLYSVARSMSEDERLVYRFAVVNTVGLALAAWFLLLLLIELGFGPWECLVGSTLLFGSYYPVTIGTAPFAEAWAWASLTAGLWTLVTRRWWMLSLAFAAGVFNKESALLLPVAAALLPSTQGERVRQLLCFVPTLALYGWFRVSLLPDESPLGPAGSYAAYLSRLFSSPEWVRLPKSLLLSFGVLWIPAAVGWRLVESRSVLARWRLLIPLIVVTPFVFVKDLGRIWFLAFPLVLPLSLLAIRSWLRAWATEPEARPPREWRLRASSSAADARTGPDPRGPGRVPRG